MTNKREAGGCGGKGKTLRNQCGEKMKADDENNNWIVCPERLNEQQQIVNNNKDKCRKERMRKPGLLLIILSVLAVIVIDVLNSLEYKIYITSTLPVFLMQLYIMRDEEIRGIGEKVNEDVRTLTECICQWLKW